MAEKGIDLTNPLPPTQEDMKQEIVDSLSEKPWLDCRVQVTSANMGGSLSYANPVVHETYGVTTYTYTITVPA